MARDISDPTTYTGPSSCPSPEELILLSDGSQKCAGDLVVGDTVKTRHEDTNEIILLQLVM